MGLFSDKKTISVSSTLYNLAGPEEDRPNYMKGTIFTAVLNESDSLGDALVSSYLRGPGIKQRNYLNYANRNSITGLPTCSITNGEPVAFSAVEPHIPNPSSYNIGINSAFASEADPQIFVEQWIMANRPDDISDDWVGDYVNGQFSIQFTNGDFETFTNTYYDNAARYIYADYYFFLATDESNLTEVSNGTVTAEQNTTGWDQTLNSPSLSPLNLNRTRTTVISYDNGDPDQTTVTSIVDTENADNSEYTYERTLVDVVVGTAIKADYEQLEYEYSTTIVSGYNDVQVSSQVVGGVTVTTTVTTTGEMLETTINEIYSTKEVILNNQIGPERKFIYKVGSGNSTLDALYPNADATSFQEFWPFLPLRIDNTSVREAPYLTNGLYDETKSAYRRAVGLDKSISKLLDVVEDNDDLGDIDYAYQLYGVSLNCHDQNAREYVKEFYKSIRQFQNSGATAGQDLQTEITAYEQYLTDYDQWVVDMQNQSGVGFTTTSPPTKVNPPSPQFTTIKLNANSTALGNTNFDLRLSFVSVETELKAGTFTYTDPDNGVTTSTTSQPGTIILSKGVKFDFTERTVTNGRFLDPGVVANSTSRDQLNSLTTLIIRHQLDANTYEEVTVIGCKHENFIYGGKSVSINSDEALDDLDESGFIVPLHKSTLQSLGLVKATQIATANTHILFNSYTVTKQRWYERGIFKILLLVLIIVIAVVAFPGAFAGGGGLLGGNLAVGAALGLSGTAAIVAGVVANYVAAIIVSQLLTSVGTQLFGEKWGALFAAIATFALGVAMSGAPLFSSENILGFSNALINGYSGYVQGEIAELNAESLVLGQDYEKEMERINEMIAGLGGNDLNFNPMFFTDVAGNAVNSGKGYLPETADQFIRRTQMTGTDLVDITLSTVSDYVEIQKTLPKN